MLSLSHTFRRKYRYIILLLIIVMAVCAAMARQQETANVNSRTIRRTAMHEAKLLKEVDSILVVKHFRHMYVYNHGALLKVYKIVLGESPVGPKHFQGDRKTPEGLYHISRKNAQSMAHKALGISYPNEADRRYARKYGKSTGGDVMIHGILNGHEAETAEWMKSDWTWGCIAVTNDDVDELFAHVDIGVPINIIP